MFIIYVVGCNKTIPEMLFSGPTLQDCYQFLKIDENHPTVWTNQNNEFVWRQTEIDGESNSDSDSSQYEILKDFERVDESFFDPLVFDFQPILRFTVNQKYMSDCTCFEDIYIFESKSATPNVAQLVNAMKHVSHL